MYSSSFRSCLNESFDLSVCTPTVEFKITRAGLNFQKSHTDFEQQSRAVIYSRFFVQPSGYSRNSPFFMNYAAHAAVAPIMDAACLREDRPQSRYTLSKL